MADEQTTATATALTIELDEKGNPKEVPEPIQRFVDRRVNEGVQTALKNAEKKGALSPAEREELAALKQKLSMAEQAAAEHNQQWKDALRIQAERLEEQRLSEIAARDEAMKARDAKIAAFQQRTISADIRTAAVAAGARDESLPELAALLGPQVTFDPETDAPIVKGADGATQTVEQFVSAYLASHPHHLGRPKGTPGRAAGGASFAGRAINSADARKDASFAAVAAKPDLAGVAKVVGDVLRAGKA